MSISTADNTSNIGLLTVLMVLYLMEERGWIRLDTTLHEISYAS